MVIEMLLNNDIKKKMILHFQKEINVIMYIIEFFLKIESFHLNKISIKYEFSSLMF